MGQLFSEKRGRYKSFQAMKNAQMQHLTEVLYFELGEMIQSGYLPHSTSAHVGQPPAQTIVCLRSSAGGTQASSSLK